MISPVHETDYLAGQKPLSGEYGASARGKKDTQGHTAEEPYQGVRLKTTEMSDVSEHATSRSSTAKGKQPITGIDGRDAEMIEMGEGSKSAAPDNDRNKGPNDDQNAEQPTDDHDADPLVNAQSVLFLCIDVVTNVSIACSVNVGINDKKTMKSLRKSYNALRNSFLWNRKRGVGVKFYRVSHNSTTTFELMLTPRSLKAFTTNESMVATI